MAQEIDGKRHDNPAMETRTTQKRRGCRQARTSRGRRWGRGVSPRRGTQRNLRDEAAALEKAVVQREKVSR